MPSIIQEDMQSSVFSQTALLDSLKGQGQQLVQKKLEKQFIKNNSMVQIIFLWVPVIVNFTQHCTVYAGLQTDLLTCTVPSASIHVLLKEEQRMANGIYSNV